MKYLTIIILALLLTTFAGAAEAGQWRTFYGANGNYEGSSSTPGRQRQVHELLRSQWSVHPGTEIRRGRR